MSWPVHSTWAARRHPKDKDTFKCPSCFGWGTYRFDPLLRPTLRIRQHDGIWDITHNAYNYWECNTCQRGEYTNRQLILDEPR